MVLAGGVLAWPKADASGKAQDRLGRTILEVTGPGSVVVTDNYHVACILHYFLVGEGLSAENRWVVLSPRPETLRAWAAGQADWDTGLRRDSVPRNARLYTLGPPGKLRSMHGLEADVRHAGNNIFEVRLR